MHARAAPGSSQQDGRRADRRWHVILDGRWPARARTAPRSSTTPTATACSPAAWVHYGARALGATVAPVSGGNSAVDGQDLGRRLRDALVRRLGLDCDVRVVPPGGLPRTEVGKARRVIRWAGGPAPLPGLA